MSNIGKCWKSNYGNVQLLLYQFGPSEFRITVGDGRLTYYYPERDCDFNTARLRAFEHAVKFASLRFAEDEKREQVATLEWEPVEN